MADSKYGNHIITELSPNIKVPAYRRPPTDVPGDYRRTILWLDDSIAKGAFYVECVWSWPRPNVADNTKSKLHTHPFDEVFGIFGMDPQDPHDLGGEAEVVLEGEKHLVDKSCLVFVPKGMEHSVGYTRVDRPNFHVNIGTTSMYV